MNFRYFVLSMTLVPSIAYTAEITPKKEDRALKHQVSTSKHRESLLEKKESSSKPLKKHPKKESATLLDKPKASLPRELSTATNAAPVAEHILSLTQPITFNGTTQPLYEWLKNPKKNKFGLTRVVEADVYNATFIEKGNVSLVNDADRMKKMLAEQQALYISNIEEKQSIQYGAIVLRSGLSTEDNLMPQRITVTTNFFLLWLIDQHSTKSKKLKDEKKDKKKEELESSKAQLLTDAVEELRSIDSK